VNKWAECILTSNKLYRSGREFCTLVSCLSTGHRLLVEHC